MNNYILIKRIFFLLLLTAVVFVLYLLAHSFTNKPVIKDISITKIDEINISESINQAQNYVTSANNNEINFVDYVENLKGGKAQFIIQLNGIWFSAGMFGCSWKIVSGRFQKSNSMKPTFVVESDDEAVEEEEEDEDDIEVDSDAIKEKEESVEDADQGTQEEEVEEEEDEEEAVEEEEEEPKPEPEPPKPVKKPAVKKAVKK